MAEIETRFLARFLLFFSYNNSNTSAIISCKTFKLARILLKILFRLLPKFFCAEIFAKIGPEILQLEHLHFLFTQRHSVQIFNTLLCAAYRKINVYKNGVIRINMIIWGISVTNTLTKDTVDQS